MVQVFELIKWTSRFFEKKLIFDHLDLVLVIFGQKVNIGLFLQKKILFDIVPFP